MKAVLLKGHGGFEQLEYREDVAVPVFGRARIDAIVDVVGGSGFPALLEVLRRGGRYAVAGAIAGPVVELDLRTLSAIVSAQQEFLAKRRMGKIILVP